MAKTDFKSVDQYLALQSPVARKILNRVRNTIRKAIPRAEETISYGIPTYKLNGRPVLYFGGWKQHYSIYPATEWIVAELKGQLGPYEVTKGTIRFPLAGPAPTKLIEAIAKLRARETTDREKAKTATSRKR